jgi:hypothetical protein
MDEVVWLFVACANWSKPICFHTWCSHDVLTDWPLFLRFSQSDAIGHEFMRKPRLFVLLVFARTNCCADPKYNSYVEYYSSNFFLLLQRNWYGVLVEPDYYLVATPRTSFAWPTNK